MIFSSSKKSLIYNEFDDNERTNWFELKQKKFINTIDTFYYSVLLKADFTRDSKDAKVKHWRTFWKNIESNLAAYDDYVLKIPGLPMYLYVTRFYYGNGTYEYRLSRPDYYDIFISCRVANIETSPVLVQLRSKALWIDGVRPTIWKSLDDVEKICSHFGIEILCTQENRIDFCWHTNYIQSPDVFFNPANFAKMRCSRLDDSQMHVKYNGNSDFDIDYITLGKKSSKNVFFRIYMKSKEVVEMGYKAFFLKLWLLNGMISRYDFYCLEYAYEKRSWYYVQYGRLKFYSEFGSDYRLRNQCSDILNGKIKFDYDDLKYFCDILTPPVTVILNVEYQTMRKFTSSLVFRNTYDELGFLGYTNRLDDILDYYHLIAHYLTTNTVRLVEPNGDSNKSRRDNCPFWECLKKTKSLDVKGSAADPELIRSYDHEKNVDIVKKRALSSIAGVNLHYKGSNSSSSSEEDLIDFITSLNDNDFADYTRFKNKRIKREDYGTGVGFTSNDRFGFVDYTTGNTFNI
ncbi:MAG: hypothetical protein K2I03_12335 [Lachnospiraceae bacterium]|nr:hypothetical protein [Lachnospiraceae bacterium]